ncbi:MAG: M14 family metallopeptidase, partial [Planctomycetota bacterium]
AARAATVQSPADDVPSGESVRPPRTAPESSGARRTSRSGDVRRFVDALAGLPRADRLTRSVFGRSELGRPLVAVTASLQDGVARPQILVNANIHGGEVEGKEAVQGLLREVALGGLEDVLAHVDVTFVPIFNVDGNDAIARANRVTQNGPDGGVGRRPNARGLDLNRDFVKVESSEVRALLGLANRLQPVAFFDLHTTNGSPHGYDLTYASSLSPNADPRLVAFARDGLFPRLVRELEPQGVFVFDYGNFEYARRERGSRGERGDPIAWSTYDPRPRFGTNLMGLRGTVSILVEAYSYAPFERRIEATRAFTTAALRDLAPRAAALADARDAGWPAPERHVVASRLIEGEPEPVRVGAWETVTVDLDPAEPGVQAGTRRVSEPSADARVVAMRVRRGFEGTRDVPIPAWFAVRDPSPDVVAAMRLHAPGDPRAAATLRVLDAPVEARAELFRVESFERSERVFQGHREVRVTGRFEPGAVTLPAGTLLVAGTPLTAQLLHPESDDSLGTWNAFDAALESAGAESLEAGSTVEHPVCALDRLPPGLGPR